MIVFLEFLAIFSLVIASVSCKPSQGPANSSKALNFQMSSLQSADEILRKSYSHSKILALGHAEHGRKFSLHKLLVNLLSHNEVRFDPELRFIVVELSSHPFLVRALAKSSIPDGEMNLTRQEQSVLKENMLNSPEGFRLYTELLPVLRRVNADRKTKGLGYIFIAPTDAVPLNESGAHLPKFDTVLDSSADFISNPAIREQKAAENFVRLFTRENGEIASDVKVIVLWHIIHLIRGHRSIMSPDKYEPTSWLERSQILVPQLAERTQVVFFDQPSQNSAHNPERGMNYQELGIDPKSILLKGFFVPDELISKKYLKDNSIFFTYGKKISPPVVPLHIKSLFNAVIVGE